jgi:hypothetical protein
MTGISARVRLGLSTWALIDGPASHIAPTRATYVSYTDVRVEHGYVRRVRGVRWVNLAATRHAAMPAEDECKQGGIGFLMYIGLGQ